MESRLYQEIEELELRGHWWFKSRHKIIRSLLKKFIFSRAATALDIGCGTGTTLKLFKEFNLKVSGLDASDEALVLSKVKNPTAVLFRGSFPEIDFRGQYDVITLLDVLEHIDDDAFAVRKLGETLAPNGIAIITVPAFMLLWTEHDDILYHKRRYTKRSFLKVLHSSPKLKIEKLSYFNFLLFPAIVSFRLARRIFLFRRGASDFFTLPKPLNWLLLKVFSLEEKLLTLVNFPFGVSLVSVVRRVGN